MAHTQHIVHRYVRNGDQLAELPDVKFKTAEEAIEHGKRVASRCAGVQVVSYSGSLETGLDIAGLAEWGELPPPIYF